jgi:hypothetical protein
MPGISKRRFRSLKGAGVAIESLLAEQAGSGANADAQNSINTLNCARSYAEYAGLKPIGCIVL